MTRPRSPTAEELLVVGRHRARPFAHLRLLPNLPPQHRGAADAAPALTMAKVEMSSPEAWPTYNGDYSGRRFSSLTTINAANVKHLSLAWLYDLPIAGTIEATPLQVSGTLYFTTPNHVYAVDARTGRERWHYHFARRRGGIEIGNRGVAILGNTVYFTTADCNLVALDIETGTEKWAKEFCSLKRRTTLGRPRRRQRQADSRPS